ncbi:type I restriction endonuclease [Achromobacter piechaudii]|uniref:Type I restriction enzyme HsdR protein N-terminal domain protein n=1 Tax=Achromobacter piechaudii ATCC 43553 TaxID=742159 RepID=D4XEM7_9BURK|nr:type I restriction endonuclease [Achromobacter piechaudii]EFF74742.1 type I restriction enzyme HsdR protein N-terminal domain protein [Achromobacter piechaudii ATCC 43553]
MELMEKLRGLSEKIRQQGAGIKTEEATKNAFVMPFIHNILGYDVFDPNEVTPEFISDVGTKKGEKVDYAILQNSEIQILIECKKFGESLNINHASQLFRYFHVTTARVSVLTNGQIYQFYTDLDAPNKMDQKPFLELDLLDVDDYIAPELKKLTKGAFDLESVISAAGELKYLSQIKKVVANQFVAPEEDFVKLFASRVYDGVITQRVRDQFSSLTKRALSQFLNDQINERLKSAMSSNAVAAVVADTPEAENLDNKADESITTTLEEIEGYHVVKAIVRAVVDVKRVVQRDTQSYMGILLDDNNRKPICRLHFNRAQKYIGIFDENKTETRYPISSIDEIYSFSDALKKTVGFYSADNAT